jgi:putative flippase GtrA
MESKGNKNKILKYYIVPSSVAGSVAMGLIVGYVLVKHGISDGYLYGAIGGIVLAMVEIFVWSSVAFKETKQ